MKSQRGFFAIPAVLGPIMPYALIAVGVMLLALGIGVRVQTARFHHAQEELATFRARVEVLGDEAKRETALQIAADQRNKERSDEESKRNAIAHAAELERMRDDNTRRSFVPAAAPGARSPGVACFDRAELDAAIRQFAAGAIEIAGKGEQATVDLNTAKHWAQP